MLRREGGRRRRRRGRGVGGRSQHRPPTLRRAPLCRPPHPHAGPTCAHGEGGQLPVLAPPDDAKVLRLHRQPQLAALRDGRQTGERAVRRGGQQLWRRGRYSLRRPAAPAALPHLSLACSSAASSALWARTASASTPSMPAFLCGWLGGETCEGGRWGPTAAVAAASAACQPATATAGGEMQAHTRMQAASLQRPAPSTHLDHLHLHPPRLLAVLEDNLIHAGVVPTHTGEPRAQQAHCVSLWSSHLQLQQLLPPWLQAGVGELCSRD